MDITQQAYTFLKGELVNFIDFLETNCPGGWIGFLCMSTTSLVLSKHAYHHYAVSKTQRRIWKRQAKAKENINTIRRRIENCRKEVDINITKLSFSELQANLQNGQLTARQVLLAFQAKALELNDKVNCVTEFVLDAEERARKLDALKPEDRGFLHGIPISMKETVGVAGEDTTSGLSIFMNQLHDDYGTIMKVLMKHGAIPFARTNVSQGQISDNGNLPFGLGIVTLREVYGPMGRDVASLLAYFKAALSPEMYHLDPLLPKIPWRDEVYTDKRPMKIGFYICDGGLEPVPAVERAIHLAKSSLENMGHTVIEFKPSDVVNAVMDFTLGALISDDGKMFQPALKEEVIDPGMSVSANSRSVPYFVRWLLSKILVFLHPVERRVLMTKSCGNVYNWWFKNEQRDNYRKKFASQMKMSNLDGIICPTLPVPAWQLRKDEISFACATYTALFNALNFPAGVIPVTRVTDEDVKKMASYPKQYMTEKAVHEICDGSQDLPIGVQCVSFPFQEEVVLRIMKEIETGLRKS